MSIVINDAMAICAETNDTQHKWFSTIYYWFHKKLKIFEVGGTWGRSSWAWLVCMNEVDELMSLTIIAPILDSGPLLRVDL